MRTDNSFTEKAVYEFGSFRLDTAERVLESAGRPLLVAPKALDVLTVLVENRGRIVEKEELMAQVWPDTFVEENNLAFNVSVLRKLFGESGATPHYIETVPKRGYRFVAEVSEVAGRPLPRTAEVVGVNGKPAPWGASLDLLPASPPVRKSARRLTAVLALLTVAVFGAVAAYQLRQPPKLTDKDTIVLADFTNTTGDPVFDGTLRQGLAVELGQSPFLSLVSDQRIRRTLRLMN